MAKKEKEIRVLIVEYDKEPVEKVIKNELETLQEIVGGYIECLPLDDETTIICNEEGKINGLPLNRPLYTDDGKLYDIIAGTFIISGDDIKNGEFVSLSDKQLNKYKDQFLHPKFYVKIGESIFPIDRDC